jgi:uncharacterized protein YbjT (DUF2867 family)
VVLDAAKTGDVERLVLLSSFTVRDGETQTTSIGAHHHQLEQAVAACGLEWAFLRCGGFATNTLGWAPQIRDRGVVRLPYPLAATAPIAARDIAAAATRTLLDNGPAGKTYVLTGPQSLTQADQVRVIGEAIGRQLRCVLVPHLLPAGHSGVQPGENRHRVPPPGSCPSRGVPGVQTASFCRGSGLSR